jgi:hypothetical protein
MLRRKTLIRLLGCSSYIQSSLAASLPILKAHGLNYPAYAEIADTESRRSERRQSGRATIPA